jgi:hypothetical protein
MVDTNLSAFIWSVADLVRGDYKQSEYGKVILPFCVLRRLDCVLDAPYTLVETTMPRGTATLAPFVDQGIPTVVVPNTSLPVLGQPVIWPFMPIPLLVP